MDTVILMVIAAAPVFLVGALAIVQARLAALYPNPESHPGAGRSGVLECFAFAWTSEHRRIRDRTLTQAVLASRWAGGAAVLIYAGLFLLSLM